MNNTLEIYTLCWEVFLFTLFWPSLILHLVNFSYVPAEVAVRLIHIAQLLRLCVAEHFEMQQDDGIILRADKWYNAVKRSQRVYAQISHV